MGYIVSSDKNVLLRFIITVVELRPKNQFLINLCRRAPLYCEWKRDTINNLINHYHDGKAMRKSLGTDST